MSFLTWIVLLLLALLSGAAALLVRGYLRKERTCLYAAALLLALVLLAPLTLGSFLGRM